MAKGKALKKMTTTQILLVAALAATAAQAGFKIDRSVMSDAYWEFWNADVQKRIDVDIERRRKADVTVEVKAPDGAEVRCEQISHAFRFGASTFDYWQLGRPERIGVCEVK